MGNDGGRIGKNSGVSAAQIEKYGSAAAAEAALPARQLHRHGARGSKKRLGDQQFKGHQLNAGRKSGQAGPKQAKLGYMRAKIAREARQLMTNNVGRAGNVRANNAGFRTVGTGQGTSNPTLRNMGKNPYLQAHAQGTSRAQARANLSASVKGMGKIGGKWVKGSKVQYRTLPNGRIEAFRNAQFSGSKALNSTFTKPTLGRAKAG